MKIFSHLMMVALLMLQMLEMMYLVAAITLNLYGCLRNVAVMVVLLWIATKLNRWFHSFLLQCVLQ